MQPNGGDIKDERVTGDMIHSYLQKYAYDHDLLRRIHFNTFVANAARCGTGWRLTFKDSNEAVETEKLLVCTGVTSIPYMPNYHTSGVTIPFIHSRDLGSSYFMLSQATTKHVPSLFCRTGSWDS